jgi:hypothetical protein
VHHRSPTIELELSSKAFAMEREKGAREMTEHPQSVEPGGVGVGTTPSVAAQQGTLGGSDMRSPRGFLGSVVLLLALPVAVLTQVLVGSGSSVAMHVALTVGCSLVALAAFDFETPRWVAWIGCVAAGAFATIFLLQAASELIRNDAFSYFALQILGDYPERILKTLFIFWFVGVLLSASRGNTRILGFVVMAIVLFVEVYNYVLLVLGVAPALTILYLLPFVWLLLESRKKQPKKAS